MNQANSLYFLAELPPAFPLPSLCIYLPVVLVKVFEYAREQNQPEQKGSE